MHGAFKTAIETGKTDDYTINQFTSISVVASLIRIHLISMLDMEELLRSISRAYKIKMGEPPDQLQLVLI